MQSFTALPPELRNTLYTALLTGPTPSLGLLRVSRQLHEECTPFYVQHNAFTLSFPREKPPHTHTLPPVPERYVKYLRDLTLNIRLSTAASAQAECARQLDGLVALGVRLTRLTVNVETTLSPFLAPLVDDTVLTASSPLTHALKRLCASAGCATVRLKGVWFAPGVAGGLETRGRGGVEVVSSSAAASGDGYGAAGVERGLLGRGMGAHMRALGLDGEEEGEGEEGLRGALEELEMFSPAEFFYGEDSADEYAEKKIEGGDSVLDEEIFFDAQIGDEADEGSEEELTEDDDLGDEEMIDVDDFAAILGNLGEVAQYTAVERDVCYLTNFAPGLLGRWSEVSNS